MVLGFHNILNVCRIKRGGNTLIIPTKFKGHIICEGEGGEVSFCGGVVVGGGEGLNEGVAVGPRGTA